MEEKIVMTNTYYSEHKYSSDNENEDSKPVDDLNLTTQIFELDEKIVDVDMEIEKL